MIEVIFLSVLALIWLVFASIGDLKKREIANWLNFSLIIFALGFRFFYSLFVQDGFLFFYQGLFGLGVFFILGNLFYYGRMFAGGDAKLMIALGPVLAFSSDWYINTKIFITFFFLFLFVGAFYGIIWSLFLTFKNFKQFKKGFSKKFNKNKKSVYLFMFIGIGFLLFGFKEIVSFGVGILFFLFPFIYLYARAVDEGCMVKKIKTSKLTEGDWLNDDIKVGKKVVKANWEGVSKKDIELLRKKEYVWVREGIPFTPVFLFAFIILYWLWQIGLINILDRFFYGV